MDDDIIAGLVVEEEEVLVDRIKRPRRRQVREIPESWHFLAWLVGDLGASDGPRVEDGFVAPLAPDQASVVGVAVCSWRLMEPCEEFDMEHNRTFARRVVVGRNAAWGSVR